MKSLLKYSLIVLVGGISLSSCTGDKGSEKVADSIKIDTTQKPKQQETKPSDTTLIDSLQTDKGKK